MPIDHFCMIHLLVKSLLKRVVPSLVGPMGGDFLPTSEELSGSQWLVTKPKEWSFKPDSTNPSPHPIRNVTKNPQVHGCFG